MPIFPSPPVASDGESFSNEQGRVYSFAGDLARYTAFAAAVPSREKPATVHAIEVTEDCVLALTDTTLKANTRQGLCAFKYESQNMKSLCAMVRPPDAPTSVIMGGMQDRLVQLDLVSLKELRVHFMKNEKSACIIRSNDKNIFIGDKEGKVVALNPKSLEPIKVIPAHSELIDFDVSGNKLITCGQSMRAGTLHGDPYVKVYDLRMFQAVQPVPWGHTPHICRFLLSYCDTRVILVGREGPAQIVDISSSLKEGLFQATSGSVGTFDFSPSKQAIAFGTLFGELNVWTDREEAVFHDSPFETILPDPQCGPPQSFLIDDLNTPLAAVPLPFTPDDSYLSDWPEDLCIPRYRVPRPVNMENVTMRQFVGYAKNPYKHLNLKNCNIVPYILDEVKEDSSEPTGPLLIPSFYQRSLNVALNIKRTARDFDDRLLKCMNPSKIASVEPNSGSAFANPLLMALYWITPLRNVFLAHLCDLNHCLSCELGFLFRIFSDQNNSLTVSTNNLMRALRGLDFRTDSDRTPFLFHDHFQFLLREILKTFSPSECEAFSGLLRTELAANAKCVRCSEIQQLDDAIYALTLEYPEGCTRFGLSTIIEKALTKRKPTDRPCSKCGKDTTHEQNGKVKKLPPILLVDTNPGDRGFDHFWKTKIDAIEKRVPYSKPLRLFSIEGTGLEATFCRYGQQCRNQDSCKFRHPPNPDDWQREVDGWLDPAKIAPVDGEWAHVIPSLLYARLQQNIPVISENALESGCSVYRLCAVVMEIANEEQEWNHALTEVLDLSVLDSDEWWVVNELMVTRVPCREALYIDSRWKRPLLLAYVAQDLLDSKEGPRAVVSDSIFRVDTNLTGNNEIARERRSRSAPAEGDIVAVDAEFIDVNEDIGRKSIARISCVDGSTGEVIMDDYVVTCLGDKVDNYLTHVSGIVKDDLDPGTSTKHLTTLKTVYLKMLYLEQRGVKFVGHALANDFTALNLYVSPKQVLDTVFLFRDKEQRGRMVSLQFLAWHLLNEHVQQNTHDSVEDARIALKLYRKWEQLSAEGTLDETIKQLYERGKACNWRVDGRGRGSSSPETSGAAV